MKRKFYSLVLMVAGLLISTQGWANLPQRPTPPMEPKALEGVEMPEMTIPEHPAFPEKGLVKKTFNKVAKAAPRKAQMGEGNVAKIGTTEYATLQAAFDAASLAGTQTTIDVIDAITESNELYIYGGNDVILNLNGKTITLSDETSNSFNISYSPEDGYEATLNDKLTINGGEGGKIIATGWNIANKGTLIVNNVALENKNAGCVYNEGYAKFTYSSITTPEANDNWAYGIDNEKGVMEITNTNFNCSGDYGIGIYTYSTAENQTATVTGGTINAGYPIYADGNISVDGTSLTGDYVYCPSAASNAEFKNCTINSSIQTDRGICTFTSSTINQQLAIYGGTITVDGGKIENAASLCAIYFRGYYSVATLNINNGAKIVSNSSIATNSSACDIYIWNDKYKTTLNVNNGIFTATNCAYCIYSSSGTINVSGGTFYRPTAGNIFYNAGATVTVDGGWYNSNVIDPKGQGFGNVNLKEGYSFSVINPDGQHEGLYHVFEALAEVDGIGYESIEAATAAAAQTEDHLVTLLKSIGEGDDITISNTVLLDLNKYSINRKLIASNSATVTVIGAESSTVKDFEENGGTFQVKSGTYDFDPSDFIAEGYQDFVENEKHIVGRYVALLDGNSYRTIQQAIDAAGQEEKTITIVNDAMVMSKMTVAKNQKITIELNGKVVAYDRFANAGEALIENNGTLTLQDNTDINGNGEGTGLMTTESKNPDLKFCPSYGSYTILNKGLMYIMSGAYYNGGSGSACFTIDADYSAKTYITGGKFTTANAYSIRQRTSSSPNYCVMSIRNAIIGSLWVQEYSETGNGRLDIEDATILYNIDFGYNKTDKNFTVRIVHSEIGTKFTNENFDFANSDSTLLLDGDTVKFFYTKYPTPSIKNGYFNFSNDYYLGYAQRTAGLEEEYPADKGFYLADYPGYPSYAKIYITAEWLLREFVKNLMPGYGLVPRPNFRGEDNWYEIRPLQGTTEEEAPDHDGKLGNPWHQDKTWDLTETDVVPQDTTPVLIDHNVYVEKDAKAEAASIIVEPEQTLTIQEGATLIVGNGGIVFNNEEDKTPGKIVVEPGATLLDGANGVISADTKNIIIKASETSQGTFLFDPEVALNTHPFGTIELISRSGLRKYPNGQLVNYWHRFASPVMELTEENFTNNWDAYSTATGLQIAAGTYFQTQIFQWSTYARDWERIDKKTNYCDSIVPFQGYTMLNNCTWDNTHKGGVTYTFRGNLVGNHNDDLTFLSKGYNYFGNSYTAPINIKELLAAVDNDDVNRTIYIWDAELQVFRGWSFEQLLYVDDETTPASIPSMQTFVMQLLNGNSAISHIDYVNAIWNPVVNTVKANKAPQRAQQVLDATLKINITAANGEKDAVVMMKDARYSNELDNGADAEKYMNEGSINLYAHAAFANVSTLAQDEIEGTMLSLSTNDETDFVMTFSCVSGEQYAIKDNLTGTVTTISNGGFYAFTTNANSTDENRFEIVPIHRIPTDMETVDAKADVNSKVKGIYSVTGQYLGEAQDWFRLPAGVYVMDGKKVVK